MADIVSTALQLVLQEAGGNDSTWGDIANNNFSKIEAAIAGSTVLALAGGTVTLTDDQARAAVLTLTGGNPTTFIVPAHAKLWYVNNAGSGQAFFQTNGNPVQRVPPGRQTIMICDGVNVITPKPANSISSIAMFSNVVDPDYLVCNGQAVSRADYFELYNVIGGIFGSGDGSTTFNVPNMNEKYPRGAGGFGAGVSLGQTIGQHTHTLSIDAAGGFTPAGTTTVDYPAHTYQSNQSTLSGGGLVGGITVFMTSPGPLSTSPPAPHAIALAGTPVAAHTHTGVAQAGADIENRPNSLVLNFAIKAY